MPTIGRLPREKKLALRATGVRSVTFLQDDYCVSHVTVGKIYLEVGAVNRPPLTLLNGEVNCSRCLWEKTPVSMCL